MLINIIVDAIKIAININKNYSFLIAYEGKYIQVMANLVAFSLEEIIIILFIAFIIYFKRNIVLKTNV
jgi:hypothetical protein